MIDAVANVLGSGFVLCAPNGFFYSSARPEDSDNQKENASPDRLGASDLEKRVALLRCHEKHGNTGVVSLRIGVTPVGPCAACAEYL